MVGAPAFIRGKERFSALGRSSFFIPRFSAGKTPGLKPTPKIDSFLAGLKSSFPLLKQGVPTKACQEFLRSW